MDKKSVAMKREEDKKHSIRYMEVDEQGEEKETGLVLGKIYIRRSALGSTPPDLLIVTIEPLEP